MEGVGDMSIRICGMAGSWVLHTVIYMVYTRIYQSIDSLFSILFISSWCKLFFFIVTLL